EFPDERGAALRFDFDDHGRRVSILLQPFERVGGRSGPRHCDVLCNTVHGAGWHPGLLAILDNVQNLHKGSASRSPYRPVTAAAIAFEEGSRRVSFADPAEHPVRGAADIVRSPLSSRRGTARTRATCGCGPGTGRAYSADRGGTPRLR